jgi:predicted transcriptional regulator
MSRGIIQVKENEDLANACQMILDKGINALLVEDSEGRLVGIIGKREILSALADLT